MAKKRNKRSSRRRDSKETGVDRKSQATYTLRRDSKIANLYFVHRVTLPPAIYDEVLTVCRECGERQQRHAEQIFGVPILGCTSFTSLITPNRSSGLRIVENVVKRIREQATPEEVLKLRRPIETEKVRRTWEHLLQLELAVIEDRSIVRNQKMSASGAVVSVLEPLYSEDQKARARKNAKDLAEKLGKLEGAILLAADEPDGPHDGAEDGSAGHQQGFAFVFPNVKGTQNDLNDMVAMNLERAKVN